MDSGTDVKPQNGAATMPPGLSLIPMLEGAQFRADGPKSLIKKLASVMGLIERVPKRGRNQTHAYDYATEADIVGEVRKAMASQALLMVPTVVGVKWDAKTTKSGAEMKICTLRVRFTLFDGESGESLSFEVFGQGEDTGDKSTYKAMTGATKYALLKLFLIPTGDDPENDGTNGKPQPPPPPAGTQALKQRVVKAPPPQASGDEPPPHTDDDAPDGTADEPGIEIPRTHQDMEIRFGSGKGKKLSEIDDASVRFYMKAAREAVNDPTKERFKGANTVELATIQAEARHRGLS